MTRRRIVEQAFLEKALAARWEIYAQRFEEFRGKCDGESLRRLRVAIRRLLSHVEATQRIYRSRHGRRAFQLLKAQLKQLGPLRDIQMQSCQLESLRKGSPEAANILKWLQKRETKKLSRARRALHKLDQMELKKELKKATRKSERFLVQAELSPGSRIEKALQNSFQKVENRFNGLDPQDVKTIHRLRVAFKHFRYLAEALKALTAPRLTAMKRYQSRMGEIQDMEVIMRTLHTFACRKQKPGSRALGPLRREIRKRRNTAVSLFWRQRNELFKFSPAPSAASHKRAGTRRPARKLQANPRPPSGE